MQMPGRHPEPLITTQGSLDDLVVDLKSSGRFAFDTEFVSEDRFEPELCLIQVATDERLVAIDPLARGLSLDPLWNLVLDPAIEVVMHAAGEDLRICRILTDQLPERVFDTQIAAGFVGLSYPLSLVNLVQQTLGITLAGSETRTDWRRRPLTKAQVDYALDDVAYLLEITDRMKAELESAGRTGWVIDEFEAQIETVRNRVEQDRWRKIPGTSSMGRRSLEIVRRLYHWRINVARDSNRPVRQVMRDDLISGIAKRQPKTRRDLEALRDFNRPGLTQNAREIVDLVAEAFALPENQLPEPSERFDDPPGSSMLVGLLNATLAHCGTKQRIAPSLIGTTSDLKELIRWELDGRPQEKRPALLSGWRALACGNRLLDVLSGRLALRIDGIGAEVPVALEPVLDKQESQLDTNESQENS